VRVCSEGPVKITKSTIAAAWKRRAKDQRLIVRDKECRGLALVVNPTVMRWEFAYRPRGVHPKTGNRWPNRAVTLGTPESLSADGARRAAWQLKGEAKAGRDPAVERNPAAVARRAAVAESEARASALRFTFGELVEAWEKGREGDRRPSYLREAVACLKRNLPHWQDRPASEITLQEAVVALDGLKVEKGAVAANRTLAYSRAAYGWALKRRMVPTNPLRGIERPGREEARERVLTGDELGAIWRACDALEEVRGAFVRTLMLTLQRREEVVSMRWSELSADLTAWTLPAERAKNRNTRVVHIVGPVRAILETLTRKGDRVFVGASATGTIAAHTHTKNALDAALRDADASIFNWRFHDFRRAGVTALAGMGFAPHICNRLLNHISGSTHGVAAAYQRAEFLAERKAALEAWAAFVLQAAVGDVAAMAELRSA